MNIYLAGVECLVDEEIKLVKMSECNCLASFEKMNGKTEELIPHMKRFLLDSGAFTFFRTGGANADWNAYIENYARFIKKNDVELFFELDIDELIGYDRVVYLREKLQDLTGKPVIPVWHIWRGKENFIQMCEEYDYVAIGGLVGTATNSKANKRLYQNFPWFINTAHKRNAKIHALGYTSLQGLPKYHFDSVDSTGWQGGSRFGYVDKFNGHGFTKIKVPNGKRIKKENWLDVRLNNLNEWIKFCKYAEIKL